MRLKTGILVLAAMMVAAAPLWAEQAPAARDFTFKRISVADSKPGKRITVQIDPAEQARLLALAPKVDPHPKPSAEAAAAVPVAPIPGARYACSWDTGRAATLQQPLETLTSTLNAPISRLSVLFWKR